MAEVSSGDPSVIVITGTHSAGKTTLLQGIETAKLTDIGMGDPEYDDLGFGLIRDEENNQHPIITVPEAALWWADMADHRDYLAENYSLGFQLNVDSQVIYRIHSAMGLAQTVTSALIEQGIMSNPPRAVRPIILSDRGPLDGIVYSALRLPDQNPNVIDGSPHTGFMSEWLKRYVSLVVVTGHQEVPFEPDKSRLDDLQFRDRVAAAIPVSYNQFLGKDSVVNISGEPQARLAKLVALLNRLTIAQSTEPLNTLPYQSWASVAVAIPE